MKQFRKRLKVILPALALLMLLGLILSRVWKPSPAIPEPEVRITAFEASDHIGKAAEVCGMVASADYISAIGGEPTFLNLGRAYPDQPFTAVIWGEDRPKWGTPLENLYKGRDVCVSGQIGEHEGTPQIRVRTPEQIKFRR